MNSQNAKGDSTVKEILENTQKEVNNFLAEQGWSVASHQEALHKAKEYKRDQTNHPNKKDGR